MPDTFPDALPPPADSATSEGVLRLLVVEDSEDDFELLLILLRKAGFRPDSLKVQNEAEMREALSAREWDLIISDDRLPHFSATAALHVLQDVGRDLPFIILSGAMEEDAAVAALHDGADDFISKSRLSRLVPAISRSLRAAESRRMRQAAEQLLRQNAMRLRALAANVPGMLVEFQYRDERLHFLHVSAGSQSLLGIDPAELVAAPDLLFRSIDAQDRGALLKRLSRADEHSGILRWEGRARSDGANPEVRWIQLGASARRDESRQLVWAGIVTDISALKRAETDLESSHQELRALSAHMQLTREYERSRIAREIHDDIGGTITALRADVAWLKHRLDKDQAFAAKLKYMDELIESAAGASMRIVRDLRPAVLDFGFVSALEWLAQDFHKHSGIACDFSSNVEEAELEPEHATAVFRVFQELLTNVAKHSRARNVQARLTVSDDALLLELRDDGVGILQPSRRRNDAFGIRGMQERARELGGTIELRPAPDGGTSAALRVPRTTRAMRPQP